jgi:UDP-N-acetylglucosamine:LPS N-acetylglucosamine transferase
LNDLFYRVTNHPWIFPFYEGYIIGRLLQPVIEFLERENPDIVITNHHPTGLIVDAVKEKQGELHDLDFTLTEIVLELEEVHRDWIGKSADLIVSPTVRATNRIVKYGIPLERIKYPLYPLRPSLGDLKTKKEFFKEHNLSEKKSTILLTAGGVGGNRIFDLVDEIAEKQDKFQQLVLCGNQDDVYRRLRSRDYPEESVKLFQFRDDIQNFFAHTDVVVAKPGATTIIELIHFQKSVIFTKPLGFHEKGNLRYALEHLNAKSLPKQSKEIVGLIESLLDHEGEDKGEHKGEGIRKETIQKVTSEKRELIETSEIVDEILSIS